MGHCPCFGSRKRKKPSQCENQDVGNKSKLPLGHDSKHEPTTSGGSAIAAEVPVSIDKVLTFTYRELATATKDFRPENFIGQGGFGSVFRGQLKRSGQIVAVKKLNMGGLQGDKEFLVEVLMLSLLHHPNLVSLIGCCAEGEQRLLVYEYMPLGSLEDHLHDLAPDIEPLDWNTRITIAASAAKGLNYLHNEANPSVIYRDIKSSNILLDEAFQPKLSDFGLAKFGPSGDKLHVTTRVMGTEGYCAPEYALSGKLTVKSDIYSFGVVLLELVTGRKAMHYVNDRPKYLVEWARPMMKERKNFLQLADPLLKGEFPESVLKNTVELAAMCLREEPKARPCIGDVATALTHLMSRKYDPSLHWAHKPRARKVPETPSPDGTTALLSRDVEREKAIAEARSWGEHWREQRREQRRQSEFGNNVSI